MYPKEVIGHLPLQIDSLGVYLKGTDGRVGGLSGSGVECRLTPDVDQLGFRLVDGNEGVLSVGYSLLPHCIVASQVPRIDAGEVGAL